MSMLVSHSMRFCTDNFGFTVTDTAPSGEVTLHGGQESVDGGGGQINWSLEAEDTLSSIKPGTPTTITVGDGDHVSVTIGGTDTITIGGETTVTATGDTAEVTLISAGGEPVTVTGGGGNVIIFASTIIHDYGGGGDSTDEQVDDSGSSTENDKVIPFIKTALLKGYGIWNCKNIDYVDGFEITAANLGFKGTECRFVFARSKKVNSTDPNTLYTLVKSANDPFTAELKPFDYDYSTDALKVKNILAHGNTIEEVRNFNNIPGFVGVNISPWYVLQASSDAPAMPSVRLDLKTRVNNDVNSKSFESDIYVLSEGGTAPVISSITPFITTNGGGNVDIFVKLFGENDTVGSAWLAPDAALEQEAYSIQFKFDYSVQTARGSDMARVDSVIVKHSYGEAIVSGESADVYTVVTNYEVPLQMCYCVVRHDKLIGSSIEAYINFMHKPKHREMFYVGLVNNVESQAELVLGADGVPDSNIDASSLKIYGSALNSGIYEISDYVFSSSDSKILITGESNSRPIYASYDYDIDVEKWRKMTLDVTEPYAGDSTYATRFTYVLPDDEARPADPDLAKVISNARIKMIRGSGTAVRDNLGKLGNGKRQLFVLPHVPDVSTIKFTDISGDIEYGSDSVKWTFDDETKILALVATKNLPLYISYDWIGDAVTIHSIACGWAVA